MASVRKLKPDDPKSPWVCEYTNPSTGKRVRITPKTGLKKDAEAARRKVEAEIERGEHVVRSETMTVKELAAEFLSFNEDRVRDGAIGRARLVNLGTFLRCSIVPHIGAIELTKLAAKDVDGLYRKLLREVGLAPITAKQRLVTLREMEDFALRRGYMRRTPVKDALKGIRGGGSSKIRIFTTEEVRRLVEETKKKRRNGVLRTAVMLECMVNLAAFCGLRYGEIIGLTMATVDLTTRTIMVRHCFSRHDGLKGPKTKAGNRDVPIPPHVAVMLRRWTTEFYIENERGVLFMTRGGKRLSAPHFHEDMWQPLLQRAGLGEGDRFHFHALRHFAASWWISNGLDLPTVAQLMGHSKVDMTLSIYAHSIVGKNHRHDLMDRMAGNLLAQPQTLSLEVLSREPPASATQMRHTTLTH